MMDQQGEEVLGKAYDARLVRRFDRVICVSRQLAARERERGLGPAVVIPNGIDLEPFTAVPGAPSDALREEFGIDQRAAVIGAIGRLSEEKGYDVLLYAAARLIGEGRDLCVVLIGDGPMEATLRDLAGSLSIGERLILPG